VQRFTAAFNFLCVLLGLLHEGRHVKFICWAKHTVNVFYSTFANVFFIFHVFVRFLTFFILGGTLFHNNNNNNNPICKAPECQKTTVAQNCNTSSMVYTIQPVIKPH